MNYDQIVDVEKKYLFPIGWFATHVLLNNVQNLNQLLRTNLLIRVLYEWVDGVFKNVTLHRKNFSTLQHIYAVYDPSSKTYSLYQPGEVALSVKFSISGECIHHEFNPAFNYITNKVDLPKVSGYYMKDYTIHFQSKYVTEKQFNIGILEEFSKYGIQLRSLEPIAQFEFDQGMLMP